MGKKVVAFVASTLLILSLSACSSNGTTKKDTSNSEDRGTSVKEVTKKEEVKPADEKTTSQKIFDAYQKLKINGLKISYGPEVNKDEGTIKMSFTPTDKKPKFTKLDLTIRKYDENYVHIETLDKFKELYGSKDNSLLTFTGLLKEDKLIKNSYFTTERYGEKPNNGEEYEDAIVMAMYEHGDYIVKATFIEGESDNFLSKDTMQGMLYDYLQEVVDQVNQS